MQLKGLVRPFGNRREDFGAADLNYNANYSPRTQTELDQQKLIEQQQRQIAIQNQEKFQLETARLAAENRLANAQGLPERRPTYNANYQPTSYVPSGRNENQVLVNERNLDGTDRIANANIIDGRPNRNARDYAEVPFETRKIDPEIRRNRDDRDRINDEDQEAGSTKRSSSDLIWLLPLLLGSLALNVFLWIHSRSLYLRYSDLADELRSMVGASTI